MTRRFLAALSAEQIEAVRFPIASDQWRTWLNVHMNFFRHGIMLEDLSDGVRELALDVLRSTLSVRGFEQARGIMRVNELIAQLSGQPDCFGEWPYFFSVFGEPDAERPWGWQLDGHHATDSVLGSRAANALRCSEARLRCRPWRAREADPGTTNRPT